jgi:hypothetical protein
MQLEHRTECVFAGAVPQGHLVRIFHKLTVTRAGMMVMRWVENLGSLASRWTTPLMAEIPSWAQIRMRIGGAQAVP